MKVVPVDSASSVLQIQNPKSQAASRAWDIGGDIDVEKYTKYNYHGKLYYIDEDSMGEIYDGDTRISIGETIVIDGVEYEYDMEQRQFVIFN